MSTTDALDVVMTTHGLPTIEIKSTRRYNEFYQDGFVVYTASCMGHTVEGDDPTVSQVVLLKQLLEGGKIKESDVISWLRSYNIRTTYL